MNLMHSRLVQWARCLPLAALLFSIPCQASQSPQVAATDAPLQVTVGATDGSYAIGAAGLTGPALQAQVAVKVNHRWISSRDYPKHQVSQSNVADDLGAARQWIVQYSGLRGEPNLTLILRAYSSIPFGDVQVIASNSTARIFHIQAIRPVAAEGNNILNLGGDASLDRVLSDSFSEDRPEMQILDLKDTTNGMHRGVGSQLIYNQQSHRSLFLGALTSDRFLSILRLRVSNAKSGEPQITSYHVDSTGTTEMTKENSLKYSPAEDQIELSLPLKPGDKLASERLLFSVDTDYHHQLETYGALIKQLHHPRLSATTTTPMGWWSWTAYYFGLNQGAALTNAEWLSQHLKPLGYNFFFIDEGYNYARGEYTATNAKSFPDGMRPLEQKARAKGLIPGVWTAPFEVSARSWVYQHHKDWLVRNAKGEPISCGWVAHRNDPLFSLDTTNPGAQEYLRQTYSTLVHKWGIRYIKMDFMEDSAIEGYYYRPNTTALEAQRIGLDVIRKTVGDKVLLDKDGSEMLNPVGYVDMGRISNDTGHTFYASKVSAPGIAARYYMNHNFFLSDPDAFTVSDQLVPDPDPDPEANDGVRPLKLNEAEVSIALAAVSGGMFEIGDDLTILGADSDRMALVTNRELIHMAQFQHASTPLDLMNYAPEDKQPSIFLLKEDSRTSILTVFNWTEERRTHVFDLPTLGLSPAHHYQVIDALYPDMGQPLTGGHLTVGQLARSVRVLKIVDTSVPAVPINLDVQVPHDGKAGDTLSFSTHEKDGSEPVLAYFWNFGDGVVAKGSAVTHTYTHPGRFRVMLRAEGVTGSPSVQAFPLSITGSLNPEFVPAQSRGGTSAAN